MTRLTVAAALVLAVQLLPCPRIAAAAEAGQCIAAHERGLATERAGKLLAARDAFVACADPTCPGVIAKECIGKLASTKASIPSVVVATDGAGNGVASATVRIDGEPHPGGLDGRPIELDPGKHHLEVEVDDVRRSRFFVARQGERQRRVVVAFAVPDEDTAPLIHPAAWAVGGVGVAGLVTFAVAGGLGLAKQNALEDNCAPGCLQEEIDIMRTRFRAADAGLGVGLVGLAGAVVLGIVLAPGEPSDKTKDDEPEQEAGTSAELLIGPTQLSFRYTF